MKQLASSLVHFQECMAKTFQIILKKIFIPNKIITINYKELSDHNPSKLLRPTQYPLKAPLGAVAPTLESKTLKNVTETPVIDFNPPVEFSHNI